MGRFRTTAKNLYEKFQNHTMVPEQRFIENLIYANWLKEQPCFPNGSIVECGVWRGGMSAGFLQVFGKEKSYLLFDSFAGLPDPSENDGEDARWWKNNPEHPRYFDNCSAPRSYVDELIAKADAKNVVKVIPGWFHDTLPKEGIRPIAFLHLDCDWYDSTKTCLERLWPHILPGGAIIIDDYFDWEGCRRALHNFLSETRAREPIERVGSTGGACIRRLGPWDINESPHLKNP